MKIEAMKITLHEMRFYAYHGVFPQEQRVGNQFVVELTFWADVAGSVHSDELEETISYADVYEVVKAEMAIPSHLLEHVVGRISERLFATFPRMQRLALTLSKCNPPFPGEVQSATSIQNTGAPQRYCWSAPVFCIKEKDDTPRRYIVCVS